MTEKQINDIIDELTAVSAGLKRLMREVQTEHNTVEELIERFTAMLPDAEPEKEFFEFMDDETDEILIVNTTDVITARKILHKNNFENVSFQRTVSEKEVKTIEFNYWLGQE